MKKIILVAIIIAAAVAIFAVVAGPTDFTKSADEKAETPVEQKIEKKELKKNFRIPVKSLKVQKLNIDRTKLNNIKKSKEENPDLNQNQKKCGE